MPGSLGVDLMYQALELYAHNLLKTKMKGTVADKSTVISYGNEFDVTWMYRGQVKPRSQRISIELHIKTIKQDADGTSILAEGCLWVDGLRIYSVNGLAVRLSLT